MLGEQRQVFAAIAQRRQADFDRVESEQQVLAEPAAVHFLVQIGIGRGDDPGIHPARARRSQPLELAGLDHPQQLGLLAERHVGDLVEEERALVGELEAAGVLSRLPLRHNTRAYALTDRGLALRGAIDALGRWGDAQT